MALSGTGGAVKGLGLALMRRADIARENELMTREEARQDALLTRQEKREDLLLARQEALALARELRQEAARQAERSDDRAHDLALSDRQITVQREGMDLQRELAGEERQLMERRYDREDRRAVEEQAVNQLSALDERIVDLQDMLLKGEALGTEGEVERQIAEAEDQKLAVRGRLVERLYEMQDPRYKDMPSDQRLYAAGYSKDQVARFMRLAGQGTDEASLEAAPAPARSDSQIGRDLAGAEARTGRSGGLSETDRAALGLESAPGALTPGAPAMGAPESPPPLRDMTQAGRGRRRPPPPPDIMGAIKDLVPNTEGRRSRGASLAPSGEPKSEPKSEPKREAPRSAAEPPAEKPAAKPDPQATKAMRESIETLLKPYGGDLEKAPGSVRQVVEVLKAQLRSREK